MLQITGPAKKRVIRTTAGTSGSNFCASPGPRPLRRPVPRPAGVPTGRGAVSVAAIGQAVVVLSGPTALLTSEANVDTAELAEACPVITASIAVWMASDT